MKKKIGMFFIFIIGINSYSVELSLDTAIEYGVKNSYELEKNGYSIKNKDLEIEKFKRKDYPNLNFNSTIEKEEGEEFGERYETGVSLEKAIFDGKGNNLKQKEIEKDNLLLKNRKSENEVKVEIVRSYMEIINLSNKKEIYIKSMKEIELEYNKAKIMYESRQLAKSELFEIELSMIQIESDILENNQSLLIEIENMKKLTGVEGDISFEKLDYESYFEEKESDVAEDLVENNIDFKIKNKKLDLEELKIDLFRLEYLPDIKLNISYKSIGDELKDVSDDWNLTAGLNFSYNIYDWGVKGLDIENAKNNKKIVEIEKKDLEQKTIYDIKKSLMNLEKEKDMIEVKKREVMMLENIYDIDKVKYSSNYISYKEFIESERELLEARIGLENYYFSYILKKYEYKNLVGEEW